MIRLSIDNYAVMSNNEIAECLEYEYCGLPINFILNKMAEIKDYQFKKYNGVLNEEFLSRRFNLKDTSYWGIAYPLNSNHSLINYKVFYKNKYFICNCKSIDKLNKLMRFYRKHELFAY